MSKNWASYRNSTKIKKVHFFGNEFIDDEFLNSFNSDIKNKDIYDLNINEHLLGYERIYLVLNRRLEQSSKLKEHRRQY